MGDRAQVHVAGAGVYLYVHHNGHEICERVAEALNRAAEDERVAQSDALARVIFDSLNDNPGGTRGYGISSESYDHVYRTVSVSPIDGTITVDTIYDDDESEGTYDIDEFLERFLSA